MSEVKPREFSVPIFAPWSHHNGVPDVIIEKVRVIEYSAYEKLQARLLEFEGRTFSENEEIEKLKAENKKLQNVIDGNCNENPYDFSQYCQQLHYNYDLEITKLTRQRDTLKKCAEFYADKNNWLREKDGWRHDMIVKDLDDESLTDWEKRFSGKTARKALRDVEGGENEKA